MSARELCGLLQWEKSRLSHQLRGMEELGLIVREPNPTDARSVMVRLLPAGRRTIEDAAPQHVYNVRRHFIDLFTPAELDTFADLNDRVLRHLAEDPSPSNPVSPLEGTPAGPVAASGAQADPTGRLQTCASWTSAPV